MISTESILILSTLVSTCYWLVLYVKISFYKEPIRYGNLSSPSILICAKNEAQNLEKHLPKLVKQKAYNDITIMNDYSTDASDQILENFSSINNVQSFVPSQDVPGKKKALTEGIDHCLSDTILLTDADCYPVSDNWSSLMSEAIDTDSQMVLGYGPLEKSSGLLNLFVRFETVITAIQYMGYSLLGLSYMGVGRNMCYTRGLFKKQDGFKNNEHIPSGDDDLFVQQAAKDTKVQIRIHPQSFMFSKAPENLKSYIKQKKRHLATSTSYDFMIKALLSLHPFFHIAAVIVSLVLIFQGCFKIVLCVWLVRWVSLILLGYYPFKRLDGKDLVKWVPILDLLLIVYYLYFGFSAFNKKNATW